MIGNGMAQVVECLPSKCEALNSNLKKRKKKNPIQALNSNQNNNKKTMERRNNSVEKSNYLGEK
jgi:hypothetical protein